MAEASVEMIRARQRGATERAAHKGHTIGTWESVSGSDPHLVGKCTNRGCQASLVLSTAFNGTYEGPIAFSAQCPYRGKP